MRFVGKDCKTEELLAFSAEVEKAKSYRERLLSPISFLYLPSVENISLNVFCNIRQHVTSVGVLYELHNQ
jgi:hypothetical protein